MQLYAITDRCRYSRSLPELAQSWSSGGVHFIQLREKDLDGETLVVLTRQMAASIDRDECKLLVNVADVGSAAAVLDAGADGVHLAGRPTPRLIREVRDLQAGSIISLPCHTMDDLAIAVAERVSLVLFSPVFEKVTREKVTGKPFSGEGFALHGLEGLRQACVSARGIPLFALGGVTAENAPDCVAAGAAGVAAIRLFELEGEQEGWRRLAGAV